MHPYRKLLVWQKAYQASIDTYRLTETVRGPERFGLARQVRRAAFSVVLNIVEGSKRATKRDFAHFLNIAEGSSGEASIGTELLIDLRLVPDVPGRAAIAQQEEIQKMLCALRRNLK